MWGPLLRADTQLEDLRASGYCRPAFQDFDVEQRDVHKNEQR